MKNIIQANTKEMLFLKATKLFLSTIILASVILGAIFTLTTNVTQGRPLTELSTMDVFSANMLGVDLAAILFIAFTAMTISKEFSTNKISLSLSVTPNRIKFYIGKFMSYLLLSSVISLVVIGLIFGSTQLILAVNGMELISVSDVEVRQFILGVFLMPVFYSLITVAATFIFSSSWGGIVFSLLTMFLPALVRMFTETIQAILLPIFPETALHNLSGIVTSGSIEYIGVGYSLLVLISWIVVLSVIATLKFQKQDF